MLVRRIHVKYELLFDLMEMTPEGKMEYREQIVAFCKGKQGIS